MSRCKKAALWIMSVILIFAIAAGIAAGTNKANASVREKTIFEEKFNLTVMDENKWFLVDDNEENKITLEYGGDDGTLTINTKEDWFAYYQGGVFYDAPVTVADDEDLIIAYDYLDRSEDPAYYFGLVKGAQKDEETGDINMSPSASLETVMMMTGNTATMLGMFEKSATDTHLSAYGSEAMREYLSVAENRQHYYGVNGNQSYTVYFKNGVDASAMPTGFNEKGYTYKHVFLASGGYECYAKPVGAEDGEFVLILKTADTWGEDGFHGTNMTDETLKSQKIFTNRSGYVGFTVNGTESSITIDNFKVSTAKAGTETLVVDEDFDRTSSADEYKPDEFWKFAPLSAGGSFVANYPSSGMLLDNPSESNYLYNTATVMITNSGIFDNYVHFTADFNLLALEGNKEFGILFGGSKGSDRLETDGCVFVYLYAEDGVVYLAADIVAEGQRVALGEPVTTAIAPAPADPANPDLITLELTGRLNGSIDVSLSVNGGEKENHTFSSEEHKVFLENRFAFLMNGEESADIGRVRLKYVKVDNKWSYHIEDTAAKSVAQNFDAVDEDGVPYINEEDMFIINQHGGYAADTEAGVYVKDGELKFVAGGQGSGLAVRHAYDNWKMTFDITDMQRQVLYAEDGETVIRTVCNAPITICFGMYAEGVGYTTGKAITLNFATTLDGKTVIHTTDPGYETSIGFSSDVLKSEIIGLATVGGTKIKEGFARHQFIDPALDGYTIRVQVEFNNGRLTCGYVVLGLEDYDLLYDPILIYENVDGEGYVGITTTHNLEGSFSGTFSIDNFKVVDTDDNSIIEDDIVPQETEPTPPVTPVDPGNDGGGKDNTVPVAIITGVSALCVGVAGCWLVIHFVNRKKANKT